MDVDFTIVPPEDPAQRLRTAFLDIWTDLLEYADPDTPYLLYSGLAEYLLDHEQDTELWHRACQFFDDTANSVDPRVGEILTAALERLSNSHLAQDIDQRLGPAARALFRRCGRS